MEAIRLPMLILTLFLFLLGIGGFFFITTRASLILFESRKPRPDNHVYWIYRSPWLIWLIDRQFISSVILLFQYSRLVKQVLDQVGTSCRGKRILQVSCVFGNFSQRLVDWCYGFGELFILDIMHSEVRHARSKLSAERRQAGSHFLQADAGAMPFQNGDFDHVISFFLFHELPPVMRQKVFDESLRVLKPGGTFVYGEFHKPDSLLVRGLSEIYFWIFEPYARSMRQWNPAAKLDAKAWRINRATVMGGYFQVVSLERLSPQPSDVGAVSAASLDWRRPVASCHTTGTRGVLPQGVV